MSLAKQLGLVEEHADEARINHTIPYPAAGEGLHTRRWPREVLEAIVDEDITKLRSALAYKGANINERVVGGILGTPMRFGDWGFFDERSKAFGVCVLHRAEPGDSALMLALRSQRPFAARELLRLGIDPNIKNEAGDSAAVLAHKLQVLLDKLQDVKAESGLIALNPRQRKILEDASVYEEIHDKLKEQFAMLEREFEFSVRERLVYLFRKYHPSQLTEVDDIMNRYNGSREKLQELQLRLEKKFGAREAGRHLEDGGPET